jgi:hypothetical protein
MNSIHIHNVATIETVTTDFEDFTTKDLIITNDKGEQFTVTLFSKIPGALETAPEEAQENEAKDLLLMSVKGALSNWGLEEYPQYHALVEELFEEAQRPGNDVDLGASSLSKCLTWGTAAADSRFYIEAHTWASQNRPAGYPEILESLKTWGLSSHPDLHKLAYKLAVDANEGLDIGLNARDLSSAFIWSCTVDGHDYWEAIDVFAQNKR